MSDLPPLHAWQPPSKKRIHPIGTPVTHGLRGLELKSLNTRYAQGDRSPEVVAHHNARVLKTKYETIARKKAKLANAPEQ